MAGPFAAILGQAGGAMFGTQVGQALAGLAGEVLSASDIGLPAGTGRQGGAAADQRRRVRRGARRPRRRRACSTSRCARPPTSGCSPTCRGSRAHLVARRRGLRPRHHDRHRGHRGEARAASTRRTRPPSRRRSRAGCSSPQKTPTQQAALVRLETILALVEGWVDEVVTQATADADAERRQAAGDRPPSPCRRRSGRGRPSPRSSASSCGRAGCATPSALWGSLRSRKGAEARDAVWAHPDLLPTAADLDDPLGFGEQPEVEAIGDEEFDAALADLLDREAGGPRTAGEPEDVSALHADALHAAGAWGAPSTRVRSGCARSTSTTCTRTPTGCSGRAARPRHGQHAGAVARRATRCC